jgi:saccharopine dehydrogenase (NAD+, L-lysine-forming)
VSAPHLWLRAEERAHEARTGLTPDGARALIGAGFRVTVEASSQRIIPLDAYIAAGCATAPEGSWPEAPDDAVIFGLKELPESEAPLRHAHIMFGHAYKGQPSGQKLLARFRAGGGRLHDLEYLTESSGRRVAAFGYWAGYAGAAVALLCWAAQARGDIAGPVSSVADAASLRAVLASELAPFTDALPSVLIIGALGRVGTGAADLCTALGITPTRWDMPETARGAPFPEVLDHAIFLNCILARPGTPVFVPASTPTDPRRLSVIGDIACDPDSAFSPIRVYDRATTWDQPALRVHRSPPLDVTAIDNLPALMPLESSEDFAAQLLPHLLHLQTDPTRTWARALALYQQHAKA